MTSAPTLQAAVDDLYRIAVAEKKATSTVRLGKLAAHCADELRRRGIQAAGGEDTIEGWVRPKAWDVAQRVGGRVRLAISLKSILANLGGSVPNRSDDLIGEAADVQLRYPETVIGYVVIMNEGADTPAGPQGKWIKTFEGRLARVAQRKAPNWVPGLIEAGVVIRVDFRTGPVLRSDPKVMEPFFTRLADEYRLRQE